MSEDSPAPSHLRHRAWAAPPEDMTPACAMGPQALDHVFGLRDTLVRVHLGHSLAFAHDGGIRPSSGRWMHGCHNGCIHATCRTSGLGIESSGVVDTHLYCTPEF